MMIYPAVDGSQLARRLKLSALIFNHSINEPTNSIFEKKPIILWQLHYVPTYYGGKSGNQIGKKVISKVQRKRAENVKLKP